MNLLAPSSASDVLAIIGLHVFFLVAAGVLALGRIRDSLTLAASAAWYVQAAVAIAVTTGLGGVVLIVRALVGYVSLRYGYDTSSVGVPTTVDPASSDATNALNDALARVRLSDLVLGFVLLGGGIAIALFHRRLARGIIDPFQVRQSWVGTGVPLVTAVLWGLIGGAATLGCINGALSNLVIVKTDQGQQVPFGGPLGLALAFTPAWVLLVLHLLRAGRGGPAPARIPLDVTLPQDREPLYPEPQRGPSTVHPTHASPPPPASLRAPEDPGDPQWGPPRA